MSKLLHIDDSGNVSIIWESAPFAATPEVVTEPVHDTATDTQENTTTTVEVIAPEKKAVEEVVI